MYAIAHIIYGIPLNSNDNVIEVSDVLEMIIEDDETDGIISYYRGSGEDLHPQAFGVGVCEFDECNHHIDLSTLNFTPTNEQRWKFQDLYNALPIEIRTEMVSKFGPPRTFLLWSSS